ncbi:uncharacterized protein PS065_014032 [Dugong dugon]
MGSLEQNSVVNWRLPVVKQAVAGSTNVQALRPAGRPLASSPRSPPPRSPIGPRRRPRQRERRRRAAIGRGARGAGFKGVGAGPPRVGPGASHPSRSAPPLRPGLPPAASSSPRAPRRFPPLGPARSLATGAPLPGLGIPDAPGRHDPRRGPLVRKGDAGPAAWPAADPVPRRLAVRRMGRPVALSGRVALGRPRRRRGRGLLERRQPLWTCWALTDPATQPRDTWLGSARQHTHGQLWRQVTFPEHLRAPQCQPHPRGGNHVPLPL